MTIEYITLFLYFGMLVYLGFAQSKFNQNLSDFVRGGAQATWWMAGSSMLMAGISAFTFTGNASAAFGAGPSMLAIYAANCAAFAICGIFLGAWFRQTRAYTVVDIVRDRFGAAAEQFSGYTVAIISPIAAAIQLWALAIFASSIFGFPLAPSIAVIGLIVIAYSTTGGRWAVMATDFAQSLILFAITILVGVLSLIHIGGIVEFLDYFDDPRFAEDFQFVKDPGQFEGNRFTLKWIIVVFVMQIYHQISMNNAHRFLALKDGREAKKAAWFACVLMAIGTVIWCVPPMVARFLYESEVHAMNVDDAGEASYAFIALKLLPDGMMGIMIAAMFAATMSSMDTGVNKVVGIVVRNMVPPVRAGLGCQPMSSKGELALCKAVTVILGLIIMNFSLEMAAQDDFILFDAYLIVGSVLGVPLGFPLLAGLYIKRLPRVSYFIILVACLMPSIYSIYDGQVHGNEWTIQHRSMWVFIFGIASTLACMAFWSRTSAKAREAIDAFFQRMRTPVNYAEEIGASVDYRQLSMMGRTSTAIGAVLVLLLFVPNPWTGRLGVLFVAGFILACGLLLQRGARIEKRKPEKQEADGA